MASGKEYLSSVLRRLPAEGVSHRAMTGEYMLYFRGKVFGGIYDDRFLIKPTASAAALLPDAERTLPYAGGKEMLRVHDMADRALLQKLLAAMYEELPCPRKKKRESINIPEKQFS